MKKECCQLAAALFLGALACGGDSPRPSASGAGKKADVAAEAHESNGDVVIHGTGSTYKIVPVATPGSITGTVTIKNPPEPGGLMPTGSYGPICGATALDESIQLTGNALGGVVVWLDGLHAGKAPVDERRLELESVQCKLRPRVQAALTGSAVNIIGHDQFMQHLRFTAGGEPGPRATVLVGGGEQVIPTELPFKTPGLVLVRDPDHSWTRAYLAVFDHPYFAVTAANGTFTIDSIPPGKYTLHMWHERGGETTQEVEVAANAAVKLSLEVSVK